MKKQVTNKKKNIFASIWNFIDTKIIIPITKLVLSITKKFGSSSHKIERWLSKTNTLLFISLFFAIAMFVIVDQKILIYSESSAEVLKSQPVIAKYNEEAYVIDGLPETVDVILRGNKTELFMAKHSSTSSSVVVDLSGLGPGTHEVNFEYNQASTSIDYIVNPSTVTIKIYPKISETKTVTMDLLNQEKLDEKLVIDSATLETDEVTIKGADYKLAEVASVKALVDVNNLVDQEIGSKTLSDIPLVAYDASGKVVDVEIVPAKLNVNLEVSSPSKEVPIKVIPTGKLTFGKAISSMNTSETKVTIYGSRDILETIDYIPVEIDVTDIKDSRTVKTEITKPVGIKSMSVSNITVTITIDEEANKEINNVNIEYRNLADGYTVQAASLEDIQVSVALKGVKSVIDSITAEDITVYLDLNGYTEGEHEVPVVIDGVDLRVQYTSKTKKVKIKIAKK